MRPFDQVCGLAIQRAAVLTAS